MYNSDNNNVKSFLEKHSQGISINSCRKYTYFYEKKAVLHTTTLMQCKAGQVLRDLFSTDQGNGSDMTYVSGTTKINLKNLKT